jgi:PAS domain S-box-containing protein
MKKGINITIRQRIYWSFAFLVFLFVINGVITLLTIKRNQRFSTHLSTIVGPSLQALDDFKTVMIESKMYTDNWVFLRSKQDDKALLKRLHDSDYKAVKARINFYTSRWANKNWVDSLNRVFTGFEELLAIEKKIMSSLKEVKDYDNPVIKLEAQRKVEEEILPRTALLMNSLYAIHVFGEGVRAEDNRKLERSSTNLRIVIILLAITIICAGLFLSNYMTKVIIRPVNKIRQIINNLGQGIIQEIDHPSSDDEIGKMVISVNNLSEKLQSIATFAHETGLRNFDMPFQPLSAEDTLGKALIAMRDNIRSSDEKFNQAQHIAHLGSLERDMVTGAMYISDEMFNILDMDPASFDYSFPDILKMIHPDDQEGFKKNREKYLEDHQLNAFECRMITTKGVTKNIFIQSKVLLDERGKINRVVGIVQDITDRKKAEEQIKLSNERYELVTKTTNDMIWDLDLVKNTIFRNENYNRLFSAEDADRNDVGKWIQQVHPLDKERVARYIQEQVNNPDVKSWELEFRYFRHNGEMAYLYDRGYILRDENKKAIRMVGATSDITERKKAEEELIESEKYNRNLFDQSPVGLALSRMDGTLEDVNEAYAKITGRSIEECKKLSYYEITPEKYSPQESERLTDLELTGRYGPYEKEYIHKDGHFVPVRLSGTILEKNGIKYIWSSVEDITEEKNAEAQLRESEERYRQIVETAQEGIWLIDEHHKTSFVNKRLCEMLGYSSAEMMGKELFYFMDEEGRKIAMTSLEKGRQGSTDALDFRFITKEGATIWTYIVSSPVLDDDGNYIGGLAMVADITERKTAAETLSNSELRFRTLTDSAPVGIFQTDIHGKTIYVNKTWLEYTGISFEEAMSEGWVSAIHPDDRKIMMKEWSNRLEKGLESSSEYRLIAKKGNMRWVMGKAVPIFNKSGGIIGHIGTVSDITERKLAIESLKQSEIKYRQIVETAQEGIWLIDENDSTSFVNKKMCEIIEYSAEELLGKKIYHYMNDESMRNSLKQLERRRQGASEIHDSIFITKSGKHIWLNISTNPVLDREGKYKGALAMMTDITQRKQHDELIRKSEADLAVKNKELEQKNKELEQFAYVASHDLQEPLRTTSSFVELFQQQYNGKLDEKADKYLHYITESSQRMKVLITDLLEYSRIGSKRVLMQVDCNSVLNDVSEDLGISIKETGAKIDADALPVILAYPTEIKQLFQNLVFNSIKFRQKSRPPRIKISCQRTGEGWLFAFSDNGIGIAKEYHERIFIIFQRLHTRNEYQGSGIGLSHCKKIVELHKGKIWLESEPGKGTTFYFTIPQNNKQ